jgi:hypothetical protein
MLQPPCAMPAGRRAHTLFRFECPAPNCTRWFKNRSGLTQHTNAYHPVNNVAPAPGPRLQDVPLPPQPLHPPREIVSPPPDFDPPPHSSPPRYPRPTVDDEGDEDAVRPTVDDEGDEEAEFTDPSGRYYCTYHSLLNGKSLSIRSLHVNSSHTLRATLYSRWCVSTTWCAPNPSATQACS